MRVWAWLKIAAVGLLGLLLAGLVRGRKHDTHEAQEADREIEEARQDGIEMQREKMEREAEELATTALDTPLDDWIESELAQSRNEPGGST